MNFHFFVLKKINIYIKIKEQIQILKNVLHPYLVVCFVVPFK